MDVLTVSLDGVGTVPAVVERLRSLVSRERLAVRTGTASMIQSLVAEVAARLLVARVQGCRFDETQIERAASGKPSFSLSGMSLSMSHSGDLVAVAVDEQAVGVDVERVRRTRSGLAERYFHSAEVARVRASGPAGRDELLIGMWVRKESFAKFDGRGLRQTISRFGIGEGVGPLLPMVDLRGVPVGASTMLHRAVEGFALATCARSGVAHSAPRHMTVSALLAEVATLRPIRDS